MSSFHKPIPHNMSYVKVMCPIKYNLTKCNWLHIIKTYKKCNWLHNLGVNMTRKEQQQFIFGSIFLLSNRFQTAGDGVLKEITLKQFLLLIVIENIDKSNPSLNNIAREMGTTRQNIKKMIDILCAKGLVKAVRLENDKRNLSVSLTEKAYSFFKKYDKAGSEFLDQLFEGIPEENLGLISDTFNKLFSNIYEIENKNYNKLN